MNRPGTQSRALTTSSIPALPPSSRTPTPSAPASTSHSWTKLTHLKSLARREFLDLLDSVRGRKGLVLDQSISGLLTLIAEFHLVKERGVEKIYLLKPGPLSTELDTLIYVTRPDMKCMGWIADQIHHHIQDNRKLEYCLSFVPRRSIICERLLEEAGVYGDIVIGEFCIDFIPLESDLLSLEMTSSFRDLFLDGNYSSIHAIAHALMRIQHLFGFIRRVIGKGNGARLLADLLKRMAKNYGSASSEESSPPNLDEDETNDDDVEALLVFDRTVDMITPLMTQLTYEGLLDEFFRVQNTYVEVDPSFLSPNPPSTAAKTSSSSIASSGQSGAGGTGTQPAQRKRKIPLHSDDRLFSQIRDLNFAVVGSMLNNVARGIQRDYEERHIAQTVSQIRDFVGRLSGLQQDHQSLRIHTNLAEEIWKGMDEDFHLTLEAQQNMLAMVDVDKHLALIEDCIARRVSLLQVLRLACLFSIMCNGIKPKRFDALRRDIVETYGFEQLFTLSNLGKLGLLKKQDSGTRNYTFQILKSLRLIVEDVNEHDPNDIAYVYSGYAPLIVRLVERMKDGWKGLEDVIKLLPGQTFDEALDWGCSKRRTGPRDGRKVVLILFLGGMTFAEVSAIRFLAQKNPSRQYVILTTQMLSARRVFESASEGFDDHAQPS